jgi:hypothetical protein
LNPHLFNTGESDMNSSNINPYVLDAWIRSGQAVEAAKELAWFVAIVFIVIGLLAWRGDK